MTKKERFFLGQVFEFLQQPHCYRFNPEDSMLYRNVNNSRVDFEPYARITGFDDDGFDSLLLKHEARPDGKWTMGHIWLYSDFHFGWGEEFRCTGKDYWKDMPEARTYAYGHELTESRLDGFEKTVFLATGWVIEHAQPEGMLWHSLTTVDGDVISLGTTKISLQEAKEQVERALRLNNC